MFKFIRVTSCKRINEGEVYHINAADIIVFNYSDQGDGTYIRMRQVAETGANIYYLVKENPENIIAQING